LAMGSTMYFATPFDISAFAKKYGFKLNTTYKALKQLETAEVITLSDAIHNPSTLQIIMKNKDLYSFEIGNPKYEALIHLLLRSYEGIFEQSTRINENNIAVRLKVSAGDVKEQLRQLEGMRVIRYQEQTDLPFISFQKERPSQEDLKIDSTFIKKQKERYTSKMNAIIDYTLNDSICRSIQLVSYFGDHSAQPCGKCDVCLAQKEKEMSAEKFEQIKLEVIKFISGGNEALDQLITQASFSKNDILSVVKILADEGEIRVDQNNALSIANDG
jgi:ATP-dependent DNA helicase RecQ